MRKALALLLAFCFVNLTLVEALSPPYAAKLALQDLDFSYEPFSPEQLDNLLAPIALYPDPLLSQVLVASTFVDDIDESARWVRARGTNGIDDQQWDVSVKAMAHYPTVLYMMADKIDWTTSLGQAYVNQSTEVMESVQRLRRMAHNAGNLVTTPQQQVIIEGDDISIVPYQPSYIYVPMYDPYICYYRRPSWGVAITFGSGFLVGAWLNRDCDWHHHRVFYHGWHGGGWIGRCRPHVQINNVYVNNRYEAVNVNRNVMHRNVNVNGIERYNSIHRGVNYKNIQQNNTHLNRRNNVRYDEGPGRPSLKNGIINRNIDTTNPRFDRYRGHEDDARGRTPEKAPPPSQPQRSTPGPPNAREAPSPRLAPHAYGRNDSNFDPRASSRRGQTSRQDTIKPGPAPRHAPPPAQNKPASPSRDGERRKP